MEDVKMDDETAKLIVQIYQKINTLKKLLNKRPFPQIKEYLESGNALSELMNKVVEEATPHGLETKLYSLSSHLESLLSNSNNIKHLQEDHEIAALLNLLKTEISLLQSKINSEK